MAPRARIALHQVCHKHCFWMPGMRVFEMHNAKNRALSVGRPERTYLCTKYSTSSVFGCPVWVCLKCTMPINVRFRCGVPNQHTLVHQVCQELCFWIPITGVFVMHNAKKCMLLLWRHTHTSAKWPKNPVNRDFPHLGAKPGKMSSVKKLRNSKDF